jgi:hypothetical protein
MLYSKKADLLQLIYAQFLQKLGLLTLSPCLGMVISLLILWRVLTELGNTSDTYHLFGY